MDAQPASGNPSAASGPVCFRHPGRETYLSCVRCGRPACPDCLREAPVGHQCLDCVKEGHQGTRRPATVFGGRVAAGAVVTNTLVVINVLLYIVEWVYPPIVGKWEMVGFQCNAVSGNTCIGPFGVAVGQDYRLITSAFLHEPGLTGFGPAHIIFNMWALLLVGPGLERLFGRGRFLLIYLLSALGGSVLLYMLAPNEPAIGASGAIFGLFGAWFVVSRRMPVNVDPRSIVFLIVVNLAISFLVPNIAWQDHIGGLVTGGLLTAAYAYAPRDRRTLIQVAATVAVAVVLVVAVVAFRTHAMTT